MTKLDEAFRMLDAFTSVGADSFVVTKTGLEWPGHKQKVWGRTYSPEELRQKLPAMVRTAAIRRPVILPEGEPIMAGENLIFRPAGKGVAFLQLDDLGADKLERVRPCAFLIHATSPASYQAWIAVSGLPDGEEPFKDFMRRVRKAVGDNDKSASHATRVAGTENFKMKYAPDYPVVTILETHPGRCMSPEQLAALGLVAPPEPLKTTAQTFRPRTRNEGERTWPDYQRCLAGAPPATKHAGPDHSMADFFWCMLAAQRGWNIEETAGELLKVSENAQRRARFGDDGYALITAQNAAAAATRGRAERTEGRG